MTSEPRRHEGAKVFFLQKNKEKIPVRMGGKTVFFPSCLYVLVAKEIQAKPRHPTTVKQQIVLKNIFEFILIFQKKNYF